jgi:hypothetical protein
MCSLSVNSPPPPPSKKKLWVRTGHPLRYTDDGLDRQPTWRYTPVDRNRKIWSRTVQ